MAKSEGIGFAANSHLGAGLWTGKDTRSGDERLATAHISLSKEGCARITVLGQTPAPATAYLEEA